MSFGLKGSPSQRAAQTRIDEEQLALVTQLTNGINWYMQEHKITRAGLAARMGVSPGRVSQILGGRENVTLRTLAALIVALDAHIDVDFVPAKPDDSFRDWLFGAWPATGARRALRCALSPQKGFRGVQAPLSWSFGWWQAIDSDR